MKNFPLNHTIRQFDRFFGSCLTVLEIKNFPSNHIITQFDEFFVTSNCDVLHSFLWDFICYKNLIDSFLSGTVSPTHFIVVEASENLTPDFLQGIAYKLTHMYFNWTGTVRVPAPCLYSHKLASLVGEHLHKNPTMLQDRLFYL